MNSRSSKTRSSSSRNRRPSSHQQQEEKVAKRFTSLRGFLSGFFQVSVEFHAGFASGILSVLPGSAAGAAALKSGRRPRARVLAGGLRW